VALATSSDARTWTKVRGKNGNGSVLDVGPVGAFDVACAYQPSVVKERSDLYRMWYRGCQNVGPFGGPSLGVIGYAESNDGITWVKVKQGDAGGAALAQGPAGSFDTVGLTTPAVFLDGQTWNMYYAGFDATGQFLSSSASPPSTAAPGRSARSPPPTAPPSSPDRARRWACRRPTGGGPSPAPPTSRPSP
jgi:hypothetical protein